jgi:hypothetical protein
LRLEIAVPTPANATAAITSSASVDGGNSEHIQVTSGGSSFTNIQFYQVGFPIQQGATYTVRFWAKASNGQSPSVHIADATTFQDLGFDVTPTLGSSWASYTFQFTATASSSNARFTVNPAGYFANGLGDMWLDQIMLLGPAPQLSSLGPNLIGNGSFESPLGAFSVRAAPTGNWAFGVDAAQGAAATAKETSSTAAVGTDSLQIDVTSAATNTGNYCAVQLGQGGIPLQQGTEYLLQFWAKADSARPLWMNAVQNGGNNQLYGLNRGVAINQSWQQYVVTFQATATDPAGRVDFCMGDVAGNVWLDGITLNAGQ